MVSIHVAKKTRAIKMKGVAHSIKFFKPSLNKFRWQSCQENGGRGIFVPKTKSNTRRKIFFLDAKNTKVVTSHNPIFPAFSPFSSFPFRPSEKGEKGRHLLLLLAFVFIQVWPSEVVKGLAKAAPKLQHAETSHEIAARVNIKSNKGCGYFHAFCSLLFCVVACNKRLDLFQCSFSAKVPAR